MATDKHKDRKGGRPEFEVAYYTRELGRPLQRKLLQKRLDDDFSDGANSTASHGDEAERPADGGTPREDRAG